MPLASDNAMPQESLEITSDDFATKQDVTTGMDQPRVNITNLSAGTDEVRSISPANLNSKGKKNKQHDSSILGPVQSEMTRGSHSMLLESEETHDLGPDCLVHRLKNVSIRNDNKLNEENLTPKPDTPPTSPVDHLIRHFQATIPTRGVSAQDTSRQTRLVQGQCTWKTNGKSKFHMTRMIVNIDVTTAVARRACILFHYQLDIRKPEPVHLDETNNFLTELKRDKKPDNSSQLWHRPRLIKLNHTIPAETAIKKAIGDLDMRPLGLDTVDLNNFRERMFNNLNQFPIFSKVTTSLTTSTEEPSHGDNRAKDLGDWSVTMSKLMPELPKGHPRQLWNHGEEPPDRTISGTMGREPPDIITAAQEYLASRIELSIT